MQLLRTVRNQFQERCDFEMKLERRHTVDNPFLSNLVQIVIPLECSLQMSYFDDWNKCGGVPALLTSIFHNVNVLIYVSVLSFIRIWEACYWLFQTEMVAEQLLWNAACNMLSLPL